MKRPPHKEPARQDSPAPPIGATKAPARSRRPSYPTQPLADEAEVEFLRSIADICNARADEVEEAKAKRQARCTAH
jgi:hypothetical protein